MSDIPVYPILTSKESENGYFDRAYNNFKEIVKYQTLPKELASGLFDSLDIYCKTNSIESFFVTLLPTLLQVTKSQFGFLAEVRYSQMGDPYLLTHAVVDIYKPGYTIFDILSNLQFHNLDTLNGAVMTSKAPVLSNNPEFDPRSGGVPFGHGKIKTYMGLPFLLDNELVGAVALANRSTGYHSTDIDLLAPLCQLGGLLISDWRYITQNH